MKINYFTFLSKIPIISNEMTDKKQDDPSKIFTYDPEAESDSETPSLTRLLNRKSLSQKKPPAPQPPESPTKATQAPPTPAKPPVPPPPPTLTSTPAAPTSTPAAASLSLEHSHSLNSPQATPQATQQFIPQPPHSPASTALNSPPSSLGETADIEIANLDSVEFEVESNRPLNAPSSTPVQTPKPETKPVSVKSMPRSGPTEFSLDQNTTLSQSPLNPTPTRTQVSIQNEPKPKIPAIKTATLSARSQNPEPIIPWDLAHLSQNPDPLGKAITEMLQRGAHSALFLSISAPEAGSSLPIFKAKAALTEDHRAPLWHGIRWKPELLPDLWNSFLKSGQIELSPPSAQTLPTSAKNVMRAAFGVLPSEWLILVRVGNASSCRGVIAFFSKQSLLSELAHVLPLLNSELPK